MVLRLGAAVLVVSGDYGMLRTYAPGSCEGVSPTSDHG